MGCLSIFRVSRYKLGKGLIIFLTLLFTTILVFKGKQPQNQILKLAAPATVFKIGPIDRRYTEKNDANMTGASLGSHQKLLGHARIMNTIADYQSDCLISNCDLDYRLFMAKLNVRYFLETGWGCRL